MTTRIATFIGAMVAAAMLTIGCAAKQAPSARSVHPTEGATAATGSGPEGSTGNVSGPGVAPPADGGTVASDAKSDGGASAGNRNDTWKEEGPSAASDPNLAPIYFGFDSDAIDAKATAAITKNAKYLSAHPELGVVLRGHTDSRGSPEYNIALGSRRALAVMEALIAAGIDAERVETVSFGEEILLVETDDETEDSRNRRVEFFVYKK